MARPHNALGNLRENIPLGSTPEFSGQLLQTGFRTQALKPRLHESLKFERIVAAVSGALVIENIVDIERVYELYGIL